jgi:hypothetical protein
MSSPEPLGDHHAPEQTVPDEAPKHRAPVRLSEDRVRRSLRAVTATGDGYEWADDELVPEGRSLRSLGWEVEDDHVLHPDRIPIHRD